MENMTQLTLTNVDLKSCPFCAGAARIERKGSRDATMIVSCTGSGCRVQSGDAYGQTKPGDYAWNRRALSQ
jgi:hypothetical protein